MPTLVSMRSLPASATYTRVRLQISRITSNMHGIKYQRKIIIIIIFIHQLDGRLNIIMKVNLTNNGKGRRGNGVHFFPEGGTHSPTIFHGPTTNEVFGTTYVTIAQRQPPKRLIEGLRSKKIRGDKFFLKLFPYKHCWRDDTP